MKSISNGLSRQLSKDEKYKSIWLYSESPSSSGATLLEQIQLQVANVRKERNKNGNTRTAKLVFGHFTLHISQWGLIFPPRGKGVTVHFSEVQISGGDLGRFTFFQSQKLLFKLWWRCSLEVAGCNLEEEPTAHPVFPLCSGSFAWNQLYCCCENAKLSCNLLRFRVILINF